MEQLTSIFQSPHKAIAHLRDAYPEDQGYHAMKKYAEEIFGRKLFTNLLEPTLSNVRACFITAFLNEKNRTK